MFRQPIVAIDGPAGAGKSTVTRVFAQQLGLLYLDTGAMYRALTWWIQYKNIDPNNEELVKSLLINLDINLDLTPNYGQKVWINGHDVTVLIRSPEVTAAVSSVAAHSYVRDVLTLQQQKVGKRGGLVAEGRDIGTTVFPYADLKIFLTATSYERAQRRERDLSERGFTGLSLTDLENQIIDRDFLDCNRIIAPLIQASDATVLITDKLTSIQVVQILINLFRDQFIQ